MMRAITDYEFGIQCSIRHRLAWLRDVMSKSSETADRLHECELEPDAVECSNGGGFCFYYSTVAYAVNYECSNAFELRDNTVAIYRANGACAAVTRTELPGAPLVAAAHAAKPAKRPELN